MAASVQVRVTGRMPAILDRRLCFVYVYNANYGGVGVPRYTFIHSTWFVAGVVPGL